MLISRNNYRFTLYKIIPFFMGNFLSLRNFHILSNGLTFDLLWSYSLPFMIFMMIIMIMNFLRVPFTLGSDTLMMTSIIAIWIRIFSFTKSMRLLIRGHIYVWRMLKYIQKLWINIYFNYGNLYGNISSLICWLFQKKNNKY